MLAARHDDDYRQLLNDKFFSGHMCDHIQDVMTKSIFIIMVQTNKCVTNTCGLYFYREIATGMHACL